MVMVFRQSDIGTCVEVNEPPTEVDLWKISAQAPQQVVVNPSAITGRGASLEWLSQVSAPELIVHGARSKIPPIPPAALRRFVEINIFGRMATPISTGDLNKAIGLGVDVGHLEGALSSVPELRGLALGDVNAESLALMSGCRNLLSVTLEFGRGVSVNELDLRCPDPPALLESLEIHGAGISSLEGIGAFPRLKRLIIDPKGHSVLNHEIDLRPLADCPSLEWIVIYMNGRLNHSEVLQGLPSLKRFFAISGHINPVPAPAPWLEM